MSKYYKNKKQKKNNSKSVFMTVITTLLIIAVISGAAAMLRNNNQANKDDTTKVEYKTVYFIPSDDWKADGSLYGAWCWSGSSLPAASFVLATDENKDGVYELKINKEYTGLTFVDLKPDTDQLGANWDNKRAQTDDLTVPTDKNVYYHQYCNEWSAASDMLFTPTTEVVTVYLDSDGMSFAFSPYVYVFDKTGKSEAQFIEMGGHGDNSYLADIPEGYTHLIFLDSDGSWDSVNWQSSDLVIPTDDNILYVYSTESWTTYNSAE